MATRRRTAHLAAPQRRRTSPAHRPAVLVQPNRIPQRVDDRPGGARVPRGHLRRGRVAVQYALRQRRRDRRGHRAVDQRGLRGKHRTRAVAGWGPDACGQRPHRARQGALRGTARSARRDGRRGAPGRRLADDRGDRRLTTTAMPLTPSRPSSFELASDEVHSWCASLDVPPETSARLYATLTPDERTRSARFRFERDQQRFIVARGVLRDLVGRYLQTQPSHIRFVYNAFGKPDLSPEFGNRLKFNLSHSAGLALIAIATDSSVGVDVEYIRAQSDYADIARRFFSAAEVDYLMALPSHLYAEAFFSCWVKKEAYLKACGEGLATPLNSFSVPLTTDAAHTPVDLYVAPPDIVPAKRWSLYTLRPAPGYAGALAIEGTGWRLRQWQWKTPQRVE